uniref:Uncharacterized protein n=1 Tax=Phlebotomus papatasi TaxID=29031 RepID=A0A1B0D7G9_PHLPP
MDHQSGLCGFCGIKCDKKCASCHKVFYCSAKHQREDWKNHKKCCPAFTICQDVKMGRFLVANRNLKFGEIVLKEAPIVTGPSQLTAPEIQEKNMRKCSKCGWPMCSQECEEAESHAEECKVSAARGGVSIEHFVSPHPIYQCILTLRCLLMQNSCPEKWDKLSQLESHNDVRKDSLQWLSDREHVAKFIPRFFKMEHKWTEEEILRVLGIVYINGHEVPLTDPPYVAIYAIASLFEHSCCANVAKSFTETGDVVFWAAREIRKGDHLSICYTDALWGTLERQQHLKETKMFNCNCQRCLDITELGTNFSAIKCGALPEASSLTCDGLFLPQGNKDWKNDWKCGKCSRCVQFKEIQKVLQKAGKDATKMKGNVQSCIQFIEDYSTIFPPKHFIMCDVKCVLVQKIGEGDPQELQKISEDLLVMKAELCNEMLDLISLLAPAENRSRGCMHFELHAFLAEMARRGVEYEVECQALLEKSLFHAEKAIQWLEKEPSVLVEGKIYAQAKINADSLKIVLRMRNLSM